MIKVLAVFGTRPEAIKMAPLVNELKNRTNFECKVCVTAQHRQMLDSVLKTFEIVPDFDLNIMKQGQTLSHITTEVINGMEEVFKKFTPRIVLVHGDTTTAFTAALSAFYNRIDVGHVEAGLRTWNKYSPFPEELNRQMVDCIADMFFAPTIETKENLLREGKKEQDIFITGNTAIDALKTTVKKNYSHPVLEELKGNRIILLTAHRRENLGQPMFNIFRSVKRITEEFPDVKVIYPIHMNPLVRNIAAEALSGCNSVKIIEPLDVLDFHNFLNRSYIILTDSGGIQEEAPSLGKPVLVLRDTTERPEGVKSGTLKLTGTNEEDIYKGIKELLSDKNVFDSMSKAVNPYGDGFAAKRIVDIIESNYKNI